MHQIILASQSPRRKELLTKAGFLFRELSVKVSEIPDKNLNLDEQIIDIARRKAEATAQTISQQAKPSESNRFLILAADTLVCLNEKVLGKPTNETEARQFLDLLSGRTHSVKTAVVLIELPSYRTVSSVETTRVTFRKLSQKEISDYVATGEPMDKAGAYGIQGLGGKLVEKYEGAFDNVVGLPIDLVKNLMQKFS